MLTLVYVIVLGELGSANFLVDRRDTPVFIQQFQIFFMTVLTVYLIINIIHPNCINIKFREYKLVYILLFLWYLISFLNLYLCYILLGMSGFALLFIIISKKK